MNCLKQSYAGRESRVLVRVLCSVFWVASSWALMGSEGAHAEQCTWKLNVNVIPPLPILQQKVTLRVGGGGNQTADQGTYTAYRDCAKFGALLGEATANSTKDFSPKANEAHKSVWISKNGSATLTLEYEHSSLTIEATNLSPDCEFQTTDLENFVVSYGTVGLVAVAARGETAEDADYWAPKEGPKTITLMTNATGYVHWTGATPRPLDGGVASATVTVGAGEHVRVTAKYIPPACGGIPGGGGAGDVCTFIPEQALQETPEIRGTQEFDGNPVHVKSGEKWERETDFALAGPTFDMSWDRMYRSGANFDTPMGWNWDYSYNYMVWEDRVEEDVCYLQSPGLRIDEFQFSSGKYVSQTLFNELERVVNVPGIDAEARGLSSAVGMLMRAPNGEEKLFLKPNGATSNRYPFVLAAIKDRAGNKLEFTYSPIASYGAGDTVVFVPRLKSITNTFGQVVSMYYSGRYLASIKLGNTTLASYVRDVDGRLTEVHDGTGNKFIYEYENADPDDAMARLKKKFVSTAGESGVKQGVAVEYYKSGDYVGRVLELSKPELGYSASFQYTSSSTKIFYSDTGAEATYIYDEVGRLIAYRLAPRADAEELEWKYYYTKENPNGLSLLTAALPSENDSSFLGFLSTPGGKTYAYGYGGDGSYVWSGNNVTTIASIGSGGESSLVEYEYLPGGGCGCGSDRPTKYIDENGDVTKWEYDSAGNTTKIRRVLGADDTEVAVGPSNAEDLVEEFLYNSLGQITVHLHPKLPGGGRQRDTYAYYPANGTKDARRLWMVVIDAQGEQYTYTLSDYNEAGEPREVQNPDGSRSRVAYNGRLFPESISVFYGEGEEPIRTGAFKYDVFGNIVEETVNGSVVSVREYSGANTLISAELVAGVTGESTPAVFSRDYNNYPVTTTSPMGNVLKSGFDRRGLPHTLTSDYGGDNERTSRFNYDGNGNLTSLIVNADEAEGAPALTTHFYYGGLGRLATAMEPNGAATAYTYFDDGKIETLRRGYYTNNDPETGAFVELGYAEIAYDSLDRITSIRWKFNPDGPIVAELTPDEFVEYHYEGSRLVSVEDSQGGRVDYTVYDGLGRVRVIERLIDATTGKKLRSTYEYDSDSNVIHTLDQSVAGGGTPETLFTHDYERDPLGRVTAHTVNGRTTQYQYDDQSDPRTVTVIDDNLVVTEHRFDLQGRHVGTVFDSGGKNIEIGKSWNKDGLLKAQSDATGNVTNYNYNGLDQLTEVLWPSPGFEALPPLRYKYDPYGYLSEIEKRDGERQVFSRNLATGVINTAVYSGSVGHHVWTYQYDPLWRLRNVTEGEDILLDFGTVNAPGGISLANYDSSGNALAATQVTLAGTFEVDTRFDAFGSRESLSYPSGNAQDTFNFSQDLFGRLTRIGQGNGTPGAGTAIADYDWLADRLDSRTLKNGTSLQLTHNDLGQIIGSTHTRSAAGDIDQRSYDWSRTYTKDLFTDIRKGGEETLLHDPEELDSLYRLNGFSTEEAEVAFGLDGTGNRISDSTQSAGLSGVTGFSVNALNQYKYTPMASYSYDANGNLTGRSQAGDGVNDLVLNYDHRNLLTSFTNNRDLVLSENFSGASLGLTWQVVDGAWSQDDGELTTGPATGNTAGFIAKYVANPWESFTLQYSLDADNTNDPNYRQHFATVMLRLGTPDRSCTEYLALTLTPDGVELIQMLGGTLSVLGSASFPNRGGSIRGLEVEFEGATVTVREANVATPLLDAIPVDVLGGSFVGFQVAEETEFRLNFVDVQQDQGAGVLTGSYTYDPLGRRVHKQVNDGTQVTATAYVYDGWRCIEEWEATWLVGSQTPSPTYTLAAQYVHGGYIDEVLVMRRDVDHNGSLEEYFYHADDQFNIVAVTNASGTVVERYEYGPFGAPTILDPGGAVRTESAIGNANLWNGREYDAETGLYYYRLRYLDPELGRFTTLDPIGLWGDPNNLGNGYAYVGNRPWTGLDPFGLDVLEDFAPNANLGGSGVHGSSYLSRAADLGLRASGQSASNAIDAAIVAQPYIAAGGSVLEIVGGIGVATSGLPTGVGAVGGGLYNRSRYRLVAGEYS